MKSIVIIFSILVVGIIWGQAFGAESATKDTSLNHPGIKWSWKIKADNYTFIVGTTSNYDMKNVTLDKDNKELILASTSLHAGNIAEIEIPNNLIGGNLTIFQNSKQTFPLIINSGNTSLIVLKFNETGNTTTNIIGTTYLPEFTGTAPLIMISSFVIVFLTLRMPKF